MVGNLKSKKQSGFTIIEVLIVLAIAGLIMLIVFLAVPALQRNSRNTQRKSDVANLLGAVNEFSTNANGAMPTTLANITVNTKLGFYQPASGVSYMINGSAAAPAGPLPGANDAVQIHTNSKCNATGTGSQVGGASQRSVIALYRVETGAGDQLQCQET